MTKEEFLQEANFGRNPKFTMDDVHSGIPKKDGGGFIVLTSSGNIILAKYESNRWSQAHFTEARSVSYPKSSQEIYFTDIKEEIIYWIK